LKSQGGSDIFVAKYDTSGNLQWARGYGNPNTTADVGYAIAVDPSNNVVVTGQFGGRVDFNHTAATLNLSSAGGSDIFVLELTSAGNTVWAKRFGSTADDRGMGLAIDKAANIYLAGGLSTVVDPRIAARLHKKTNLDALVMKLNASGGTVWQRRIGGDLDDEADGIAVDDAGNAYVAGRFSGTADLDPGSGGHFVTSAGGRDGFVVKLDSAGRYVASKRFGSSSDEEVTGIARTSDGRIVVLGNFRGTVNFNPGGTGGVATSAGGLDAFVAQFDSNLNFRSVKTLGGAGDDRGKSIAIDALDQVFLTGEFRGSLRMALDENDVVLASQGGADVLLAEVEF
jgi:hypothetical protein